MDKKLSISEIAVTAVMTAVICLLGPLSIPIGPVPISLSILAIFLSVYILGTKLGFLSIVAYLLLGLAGVPVFAGFTSGPAKLLGPTGGYLVGYLFLGLIMGVIVEKSGRKWYLSFLGMVLGTAVLYAFGTVWLAFEANMTAKAALMAGVIPFIPFDIAKMVLALLLGSQVRKALVSGNLLPAAAKKAA